MKNSLILLVLWGFAVFFTAFGIILAITPARVVISFDWWIRANRWTRPNPRWDPGYTIETRLAGVGMALMGIMFIARPLYWILAGNPSRVGPAASSPARE